MLRYDKFISGKKLSNKVNGKVYQSPEYYLNKIDWKELCDTSIPNRIFHGDMQFDNIINTKDGFKFIDWRDTFGEQIDYGDSYYDLAKLYGGICMNYSLMKDESNYTFTNSDDGVEYSFKQDPDTEKLSKAFKNMCVANKFNFNKIEKITALIYLNMAPLHDKGFDYLLYYHSLSLLGKIYDK
jgi:thiamine kinase-like enzyme